MSRYHNDDESAGGSRHQLLSRRDSHGHGQQRSTAFGNRLDYPHNAINSHRQIQRHIDYERAQPVRVPSERTSIYMKNSDGFMDKTDRYGNKVGIRRQVLPGIDQHHLIQMEKQNNLSFDSDDAANADLGGPVLPKKRKRPYCCSNLKEIDMYGITPGMMIEGKSKFKSWWGAFFSLLVILSVLSYVGLKVLFTLYNQTSNIQARHLFNDFGSELGQAVMSLSESQVSVDFEFRHNPASYAVNKSTPISSNETYLQDLQGFFKFIVVEAQTIERDLETQTDRITTETLPFEVRMKEVASSYGTPTMRVDASMLKIRGDPSLEPELFQRGHSYGVASREKFQGDGLVKELADWVHLDGPFPDLKPYAMAVWKNVTALITRQMSDEADPEADDTNQTNSSSEPASDPKRNLQAAGEAPPPGGEAEGPPKAKSELVNPITTQIRFRPDYQQLEDLATRAFEKQPGVYLEKQTTFDQGVYRTYSNLVADWERENAQQYLGGDLELWQFRKRYYEEFLGNCSNYMVSMVINDKFLAQDGDNEVVLVDRHDRVFTKPFYPDAGAQEQSHVRFQVHTYERDNHFHWPSAHWIFNDEPAAEAERTTADRFMVHDQEYVDRIWTTSQASYPYEKVATPEYTKLTLDPDLLTSQRVDVSVTTAAGEATSATIWNATQTSDLKYTLDAYASETQTVKYQQLGESLLEVGFYQNPVSVWHQKQDFRHWVVDQCADVGGFIVFCFLVFGTLCVSMQWRLYEARLVQDRYRLKFNKILRGVKDQTYQKRSDKDGKVDGEDAEFDEGQDLLEDDADEQDEEDKESEQSQAEREKIRQQRKEAKEAMIELEKELNATFDVEGGQRSGSDSEENQSLDPEDICDFDVLTDEERQSRVGRAVELWQRRPCNVSISEEPASEAGGSDKSGTVRIDIFEGGNEGDGKNEADTGKDEPGTTRPLLARMKTGLAALTTPRAAAQDPEKTEGQDAADGEPAGTKDGAEPAQDEGEEGATAQKNEISSRLQGMIRSMFSQKKADPVVITDKPEEEKEQDKDNTSKKDEEKSKNEDAASEKQSQGSKKSKKSSSKGSRSSKKAKSAGGSQGSRNKSADAGATNTAVAAALPVEEEDTRKKIMNALSSHVAGFMRRTPVPPPQPASQQEEARSQSQHSTPAAAIAIKRVDEEEEKQPEATRPEDAQRQSTKGKIGSADEKPPIAETQRDSQRDNAMELREDIGDDVLPDLELEDPQDADAEFQPQDKPKYKLFEPLRVSTFQVVRLAFTPSCLHTYYQMALDRMLKKAVAKFKRDIEVSTLLKRVCDANNLSRSMEEFEVFKGLKKQYKNSYSNVVNVSLDTEISIVEENQKPIQPAEPPYQRRKLKKYVEGPDGVLQGVMELQPYELDPAALTMIARTVWRKLRQDATLTRQMAEQVRLEARLQEDAWGRDFAAAQLREPRSEQAFERSSARREEITAGLEAAPTPRPPHSEAGGRKTKDKPKERSRPESKKESKSSSKPTKPAEPEGGREIGSTRGRTKTKSEHKSTKSRKEDHRSEPHRSQHQRTDVSNPRTEKRQPEVSEKRRASTKPRESQPKTESAHKLDYSVFSKEKPPPNLDADKAKQLMARYLRKQLRKQGKNGKR